MVTCLLQSYNAIESAVSLQVESEEAQSFLKETRQKWHQLQVLQLFVEHITSKYSKMFPYLQKLIENLSHLLGVSVNTLEIFSQSEEAGNTNLCLQMIVREWLNMNVSKPKRRTWQVLADAMEHQAGGGYPRLAKRIADYSHQQEQELSPEDEASSSTGEESSISSVSEKKRKRARKHEKRKRKREKPKREYKAFIKVQKMKQPAALRRNAALEQYHERWVGLQTVNLRNKQRRTRRNLKMKQQAALRRNPVLEQYHQRRVGLPEKERDAKSQKRSLQNKERRAKKNPKMKQQSALRRSPALEQYHERRMGLPERERDANRQNINKQRRTRRNLKMKQQAALRRNPVLE